MMKFFRRYKKQLLAVFMALLLVLWLLDDTIRNLGDRGRDDADFVRGQAFGQTIRNRDMADAMREAEILTALRLPWDRMWMNASIRQDELTTEEWYLLTEASRRSGYYIPQSSIQEFRQTIPVQLIEGVRKSHKASIEEIDRAIQSYLRVQEVLSADLTAVKVSEADVQNFIRQTEEKARVKLVALDYGKFIDPNYNPTDEEIQKQFEQYKDKDPGGPGDSYGYRLPEQVQIEYIRVLADQLARRQQITDDRAYDYWKTHRNEFLKPVSQPATDSAPASREAPKPYETFTEAREEVRKRLQNEEAKRQVREIAAELIRKLQEPWQAAPTTQPGGFREPPAAAKDRNLYPHQVDAFRAKYPNALIYAQTQLVDRQGLSALGDMAWARALPNTEQQILLSRAAFLVAGLEAKREDMPEHTRFFRNLYETAAEPFIDSAGNAYVFRTIDIRPKRVAASAAEVREQVVRDIRLQRAADQAKQLAEQLAEGARQVGLTEAYRQNEALAKLFGDQAVRTPQPFSRKQFVPWMGGLREARVPEAGGDINFVDRVFSMVSATTTQPSKVLAYAPEGQQRWLVVELLDIVPVTQAEYAEKRMQAMGQVLTMRRMDFLQDWFSNESIEARAQWKSALPEAEEKEKKTASRGPSRNMPIMPMPMPME